MSKSPGGFKATVVSMFGAPGTGKTTLIRALLQARQVVRYIAIDPYGTLPGKYVSNLKAAQSALRANHRSRSEDLALVYFVGLDGDDPPVNPAEYLGQWALRENAILIIDEAHEYADAHSVRRSAERGGAPMLARIARQGRHHDSGIWICSQRPSAVARDLTANSERFFLALNEPIDLKYVRDTMGKTIERRVASLPDLHYVYRLRGQAHLGKIEADFRNDTYSLVKLQDLTGELPLSSDG